MSMNLEETFREAAPLHFIFKIESFSLLSKNSLIKYESNEFETGGYKWKLSFYPDGNKNESGNDHISMYLLLVDSSSDSTSLPDSWELNVFFRLFLFDHIRDRYFIRGDTEGRTRRFHDMKKVWGFPQLVSLAKFKDPANGYLVDDVCVFGAEVFLAKPPRNIECLSMIKQAATVSYKWKIENFSNIKVEFFKSEKFKAGDYNWCLEIYPEGHSLAKNNSVSLFLNILDCTKDVGLKVYTNYTLRIRDQNNGKHTENSSTVAGNQWFSASNKRWGWKKFIGLSEMNDKGKGYLVNDTCIVEAEVKVLGIVTKQTVVESKLNISEVKPQEEVAETFREDVPAHFLFKIQAFSLLSKNSIEKYESNEFEAGGYKWSLLLYPDGNKAENGDDHVSLYLVLEDSLPTGLEINVQFRLFLFDQIREKYLIREDMEGKTGRFQEIKKVQGFPQFISLTKFEDLANGYLVDDTCVFGAEVFVTRTWRIDDFSKIKEEFFYSEKFKAGDHYWNVLIYPKGDSKGKGNSVSLYLNFADCVEKPGLRVRADFKLRVCDQINGNNIEKLKRNIGSRQLPWTGAGHSS